MSNRWWGAAGLAAAALVLAACGSSAPASSGSGSGSGGGAATSSGSGIKTTSVKGGTVLTNSAGRTLYWYAIDSSTTSKCSGTCATFWPPAPAGAKAASGVSLSGSFGSITRSDGSTQLTYMGHPLYTFKLDTASGQDNGNGVTTSGGPSNELWWAMTPTGAKLAAAPKPASSSSSSGGGGGGYGY
jgi:predicted lipoprotein with Yx(FWY)xxD motif